jgi:hypothetical protein
MLNPIFPERIDNHYHGHKFAFWLLVPIIFLKVVISLVAIFAPDGGAQSADGLPLDSYGAGGAEAVISLFAVWGLSQLLLGLLFVVALVRYRAMIPLIYVLILVELLGKKVIFWVKPIVTTGTTSAISLSLVLIVLSIIGLALSLSGKAYRDSD